MSALESTVQPFTIIPDCVIYDFELNARAGWLYTIICSFTRKGDRTAFPSRTTLAKHAGMSEPTVDKYLGVLESKGLIHITRRLNEEGDNDSNLYTVVDPGAIDPQKKILTIKQAESLWEERKAERERRKNLAKQRAAIPTWTPGFWRMLKTIALIAALLNEGQLLAQETIVPMPDSPRGEQPEPPAPEPSRYKSAVAVAFGWKTAGGTPDCTHARIGTMITQLRGTAQKGERKKFAIGSFDDPDMIVGLKLWYVQLMEKAGSPKEALPTTAEALYTRAREFMNISEANRTSWIEAGRKHLDKALGIYDHLAELNHSSDDWTPKPPPVFGEGDVPGGIFAKERKRDAS